MARIISHPRASFGVMVSPRPQCETCRTSKGPGLKARRAARITTRRATKMKVRMPFGVHRADPERSARAPAICRIGDGPGARDIGPEIGCFTVIGLTTWHSNRIQGSFQGHLEGGTGSPPAPPYRPPGAHDTVPMVGFQASPGFPTGRRGADATSTCRDGHPRQGHRSPFTRVQSLSDVQ